MQGFSSSFLIFFYQIALGGMFAVAGTPFHEIERGFYKSTAGVLYFIAVAGFLGKVTFYLHGISKSVSVGLGLEIFFHSAFILAFTAYMISLWGERQLFRARSFAATLLTGLAGLLISTHSFSSAPLFAIESMIYPAAFFLSSLLLGSVTVGMLIGHWYLIDTGQSLAPFMRIYKFFVYALIAQCVFYLLAPPALYLGGSDASVKGLQRLWQHHSTLLVSRLIAGQIAPLVLSWMIWRTLLIPHTMAATGLFYIALLGVFVGEILGRQILALTSLPF
ncbi:MAG TPA: hypothetical protein VFK65_20835 [Candidatus Binatia bacterium]|nr:hypothetical protein [Candidatus Binatia bacterium]